jgi:hypothetical protein
VTHTQKGPAQRQLVVQPSKYVQTTPWLKHGPRASVLGQIAGPSTSPASLKGADPSTQSSPWQWKTPGGSHSHWISLQSLSGLGTKQVAPTSEQASPFRGGGPSSQVEGVDVYASGKSG